MVNIPPELRKHEPPVKVEFKKTYCIVTGMGQSLMDDFMRARNKVMQTGNMFNVMGANRSCQFIKTDMNFSLDRDNIQYWRDIAMSDAPWHSGQPGATRSKEDYPWVDYWWPMVMGSGSSAWGAAKVALLMGYERVVLCGAPLEPGPYADGIYATTFQDNMNTLGVMRGVIEKDKWMHPYVSSMSGWTKKVLGGP
jgi:hypothetical protein